MHVSKAGGLLSTLLRPVPCEQKPGQVIVIALSSLFLLCPAARGSVLLVVRYLSRKKTAGRVSLLGGKTTAKRIQTGTAGREARMRICLAQSFL